MKTCIKCKIEKPKIDFHRCSRAKDGLQTKCKACMREYQSNESEKLAAYAREYRNRNAGKIAAKRRERYIASVDKVSEYAREYYRANSERLLEYGREYYKANPNRHAELVREWRKENPEKYSAHKRNRRARQRNAEGSHTAKDVLSMFTAQLGLCASCKTKLFKSGAKKYHVDHIMPLKLGGSNWPTNLQCLCPSCNLSKGAKHPDDWAAENGRLI